MELNQCGVEARFNRSHGNIQDLSYFAVLQTLVISQDHNVAKKIREFVNARPNELFTFFAFGLLERVGAASLQKFEQRADFTVAHFLLMLIQADRLVPAVAPQGIDRLVCRDRIKPGPDRPAVLILPTLDVNLEKGVLEYVFGEIAISQIAPKISVQLPFIAAE
jgi:hypothetical protein